MENGISFSYDVVEAEGRLVKESLPQEKAEMISDSLPKIEQPANKLIWFKKLPKDLLYGSAAVLVMIFLYYFLRKRSKVSKIANQTNPKLQHPENSQKHGIEFPCPHCGVNISAEAEAAGTSANCPTCAQDLVVPTVSGQPSHQKAVVHSVAASLPSVPRRHDTTQQTGKKTLAKPGILALIGVMAVGGFIMIKRDNDIDLNNPEVTKEIEKKAVYKKTLQSRSNSGDSLLYPPNSEAPYTGWIKETSSDGDLELTQIKNGVLEGVFVTYLKSGQKSIEGVNKNGKKNGKETDWYKNGQKDTEVIFENGNVSTLVSKYKPNGDQCQESKVENGNGKTIMYDEKGDIIATVTYKSGVGTLKFNKPDPDKYTIHDMEALMEQELRINRLKSKLEDSGNYSDKTFFFARIQSICDTDWSKCSPNLSICANTLKRTIDLYSNEKASFKEVLNTSKAFLEMSSKRSETFDFAGINLSKMIDETRADSNC